MALINPLPRVSQDGYLPNVIEGHGSLSPLIGQICHTLNRIDGAVYAGHGRESG